MSAAFRPPDMPPEDRALVRDFLSEALVQSRRLNAADAVELAEELLEGLLAFDDAALDEVTELCREVGEWGDVWQNCSLRVRHTISRYYTVNGLPPGAARTRQKEGPSEQERYDRRYADAEATARREARRLDLLDAWNRLAGRPIAELFALWEPADDPCEELNHRADDPMDRAACPASDERSDPDDRGTGPE